MDEKDNKILSILRKNSRTSIRDIAKKTGIRPSTVHKRITNLVTDEVIEQFTVKLDNKAVEENFIVIMLVKTKPATKISKKILSSTHVKEAFGITGEYDLLLKLKFRDIEQFNEFVLKFRKEEPVKTTLTMVATTNIKEEI